MLNHLPSHMGKTNVAKRETFVQVALVTWLQAAVAITLPAVRGLLQQRYSSRSDVVTR